MFVKELFFRFMLIMIYKCKIWDLMWCVWIKLLLKKGCIMMGILDDIGILEYG